MDTEEDSDSPTAASGTTVADEESIHQTNEPEKGRLSMVGARTVLDHPLILASSATSEEQSQISIPSGQRSRDGARTPHELCRWDKASSWRACNLDNRKPASAGEREGGREGGEREREKRDNVRTPRVANETGEHANTDIDGRHRVEEILQLCRTDRSRVISLEHITERSRARSSKKSWTFLSAQECRKSMSSCRASQRRFL